MSKLVGGVDAMFPSPFFTPSYGSPLDPIGWSPIGRMLQEQEPDIAFYRYGRLIGVPDDQSAFARWFRAQFPLVQLGYGATTIEDPFANLPDYLGRLGVMEDWLRRFMLQTPRQRGIDPVSRGAGWARWLPR